MGRAAHGALALIAQNLVDTYDLHPSPDIAPFLLSQARAGALGLGTRGAPEQVFVVEHKDELPELGLYLRDDVLDALEQAAGAATLQELMQRVPLGALMYATEGVSHVIWLMQRINACDSIRQLELELQAEIDKFVIALLGCEGHVGVGLGDARNIMRMLFVSADLAADLCEDERARYRQASRAAEAFVRTALQQRSARLRVLDILPQLRRFCRSSYLVKLV